MTYVHLNIPRYDRIWLQRHPCPYCKKERFFLGCSEEWYGFTKTCLRCGDSFTDEGWNARPFERAWRKRVVRQARELWIKLKRKGSAKSHEQQDQGESVCPSASTLHPS